LNIKEKIVKNIICKHLMLNIRRLLCVYLNILCKLSLINIIECFNNGFSKGGWLPVGSVSTMSTIEPNLIKIINKDWVVWKGDEWSVQEDVCLHRKAPLSQGRIDNKCIECPYHGWQYNENGDVVSIPQNNDNESTNILYIKSLKTCITNDLLWAFFPEELCGEYQDIKYTPDIYYADVKNETNEYFVRELPYSFDMLIENFMDPGHIPYAHHGLQGVRTDGMPIPMKLLATNETHLELQFEDKVRGKSRTGIISYQRPASYHFRTLQSAKKKGVVTSPIWKKNLQLYAVPVEEGKCRVFIKSPFKRSFLPVWAIHAMSNRFLNTDAWLNVAEYNIDSIDVLPDYKLIKSDLGVIHWRLWWKKWGQYNSPIGTFGRSVLTKKLKWHEMIDTWDSHTRFCNECKKALKRYRWLKRLSYLGIIAGIFSRCYVITIGALIIQIIAIIVINIITGVDVTRQADRSVSARAV
jgi:nitrite reductase/ring-hydroxylating ferredoxin subunit